MQSQVLDRPTASQGTDASSAGERPFRKTVLSAHNGVLVCVEMRRVVGCVRIEKLTRVPGSHERIAGILLFRGRPVPLVSIGRDSRRFRNQRRRTEEHALVVSARDKEFALRVDGVPRIIDGPLPYQSYPGRPCVMRTKHLDRFFELCVIPGNESISRSRVPDCRRAA